MSTSQIHVSVFLSSVFVLFGLLSVCTNATENITLGQFVTDGQTIISFGKKFELGFFSPGNSSNRYVGIWFYKIPIRTVVWVANRENPILDRRGVLNITDDGNLVVMDGDGKLVWSTNVSIVASNSTAAVLMDNGNLKLRSGDNSNKDLWQSFNDPTDTFLPGMKMGYNSETGENNIFTSWKSADDPSKGNYHMGVDLQRTPQILIWEGFKPSWRSGEWDGQTFVGVPHMRYLYLFGFKLISGTKKGEMYFTYTVPDDSDILRYWIGWDGRMKKLRWDEERKEWILTRSEPTDDECGFYNRCGAFGRCSQLDSPICSCFHGYEPKDSQQWSKGNWSGGCGRRTELQCEKNSSEIEDGFTRLEGIKLPDFSKWVTGNGSNGRIECEEECLRNCSCNAYAYVRGIGCLIWSVDLVDVQQFQEGGKTIYIRLAGSELLGVNSGISKQIIVIIAISVVVLLSISIYSLWRFIPKPRDLWRKRNEKLLLFVSSKNWEFSAKFSGPNDFIKDGQQGNVPELPLFDFDCVAVATRNFSEENKLGQGGFGPVYKGMLPGGQEVAVKRLSRSSIQGLEEFMNEIILIAKLQHRNLVRLLGCCIRGEEKMLLYEYMPNGSLDSFIFDPAKQGQLDWRKRFRIIEGIARGLLYLHRDSRLRIIHRDLKASNILLDNEMNPKISDFGMAKIFGGNQNHANTERVVGTYGYMSPEYAMKGLVSVKTDVYSFGVSLLEIVSGKRNSYISHSEHNSNLIGYAWHLWSEGKGKEFMDSSIVDTCLYWEVLRCIHVGLLCVQDSAMERPTMSSVLLMLESETANVPNPKQPTFSVV